MGKKSGPSPPPAPDPYATAAAQTAENRDTAIANAELNRVNQYTPWGNLVYNVTGTNADGTPIYTQTQTLSPAQQQQLDMQNQLALALGGFANQQLGRVSTAINTPFNFNGAPSQVSSINLNQLPQMVSHINQPNMVNTIANAGSINRSLGPTGNIQNALGNYGSLDNGPSVAGVGDFSGDRQHAEDAIYQRLASRLDPQFSQAQSRLDQSLNDQGIPVGSQAGNTQQDTLARARNDAYSNAALQAVQAGSDEQARLFGESLDARQQYAAEQAQRFSQALGGGNFANEAQAQAFAQALSGGQFANQAQQQQYEQNASNASFYNTAAESAFQQALANAGLANTTNSQMYNQLSANATLQNQARQQYINEATYLRNLPLSDIATLMGTAGAPQSPNFQPVANTQMANTDLMGAVYDSYNANFNNWNAQQQMQAANKGQIFGALGTGAGMVAMSDMRIKENVKPIGELWNGIKTYTYNLIGDVRTRFGVMAQEIKDIVPEAVIELDNGLLAVDYGKVF